MAPAAVAAFPANHGTGFFVNGRGDVVTAHHVAGACERVVVETAHGVLTGEPIAVSETLDITVVRTGAAPSAYAVLPDRHPPPGPALLEVVSTERCGGLASLAGAAASGREIADPAPGRLVIRSKRPIVSGNSGSPVVDANGLLAGMLVARGTRETTGVAVRAQDIAAFLRSADIPFGTAPRTAPLAAPPYPHATAYTAAVDCFAP